MKRIAILLLVTLFSLAGGAAQEVDTRLPSVESPDSMVRITVPDSLRSRISDVLEGRAVIVDKPKQQSDLVIIKGDTVSEILKSRNFGRFDRGLFNWLFIPKGQWEFGITASYGEFSTEDFQLLDLMNNFDFNGHAFSIKPYIAYSIANNITVGVRLGYTEGRGTLKSLSVDFDEDLSFDVRDASYHNETYTAAAQFRQFIGLARRGRFGVYNEVELAFSSGNSDFDRLYGGKNVNTHTTYMEARLSFSPGIRVFIMKNVSFNVAFAVVGFHLRNEKQLVDNEPRGNRFTSGANFRFNIFNINFGLAAHI